MIGSISSLDTLPMITCLNAQSNAFNLSSKLIDYIGNSQTDCICQCFNISECLTGSYIGINKTCSLFSMNIKKQSLRLVVTNIDVQVFTFPNRTVPTTITTTTTTGSLNPCGVPGGLLWSKTGITILSSSQVDDFSNFYVADSGNNRIQLFCANSSIGITIAGTGMSGSSSIQLNNPQGIAFDSAMNLYVTDRGNHRIQKFMKL